MKKLFSSVFFVLSLAGSAQNFRIIPLGVRGGAIESNLSSYLISEGKSEDFFALDAGTLYSGIQFFLHKKASSEDPADFLKKKAVPVVTIDKGVKIWVEGKGKPGI